MTTKTITKQDELTLHTLLFTETSSFSQVLKLGIEKVSPVNLYGRCTKCACPGFQGSDHECTRGGCQHHYDQHSNYYD